MMDKLICRNRHCGWCGTTDDALKAPNPFIRNETLLGCPGCLEMSLDVACDEPNCWAVAGCGTPTPTGYRHTCINHAPLAKGKQNGK